MKPGFDKTHFLAQAVEADLSFINRINTCLVLAPHPDDESLGCGGLISLLKQNNVEVRVIFTTDGSMSHPNSRKFNVQNRIDLRQQEAIAALHILGVKKSNIDFMDGKDAALPFPGTDGFEANCRFLQDKISNLKPQLILVPYELDPHCDHRATWQMLRHVLQNIAKKPVVWEYPIWLYEFAEVADIPQLSKGQLKYVELSGDILCRKINAIEAHASQVSRLIDDDPAGFILLPEVIAHFSTNREYYIQQKS